MLTGQKIAQIRVNRNLTQEQLAEKLFVSRDLISKWETNKRTPDYKAILKLAEVLCVEPEAIANKNDIMLNELSGCIPENVTDNEKLAIQINSFLSGLNERERCVFIRRYYYFEEISEIAEEYCIKAGYVRTVLMRTRRKLTKFLKEM